MGFSRSSVYAGHDHIAGYEVMSEPRVGDASAVHAFHLTACHHVWKGDPAAGCFVGPTKFYDRTHLSSAYLIADARVVYAPEPPYKPIKPCPYKPESLDKCVAEAKAMCEDAMSAGYEACKTCVWSDRGELIYDDCSWKRRHGKIVEHVCGPEPGQHTTVEECVDVEGEISYDDEKTFPQEEHFPDDDEAFDDDDWL